MPDDKVDQRFGNVPRVELRHDAISPNLSPEVVLAGSARLPTVTASPRPWRGALEVTEYRIR